MANRVGTFSTFANLAPPWSLPTLDANFVSANTALNDASLGYVNAIQTDTGTANSYIVSTVFGTPSAYNQGMYVAFIAANSNIAGLTGASVINVNGLGSESILDIAGNALIPNTIQIGQLVKLIYVGSAFRLIGPSGGRLQASINSGGTQTFTVNCAGYFFINIYTATTITGETLTVQFNNLAPSIPIYWVHQFNTVSGSSSVVGTAFVDVGTTSYGGISTYNIPNGSFSGFPVTRATGKTSVFNAVLFFPLPSIPGTTANVFIEAHN